MKRYGNLYQQICSIENLQLADKIAQRGKKGQYGVQLHNRNQDTNILLLHEMLLNKTYKVDGYTTFTIREPKEREIYRLQYYPHRIVQHAVMNVLKPIFVASFTKYTYSCIEGRGIHKAMEDLKKALTDEAGTAYCLKFDIKKFYPSVDHEILKGLLRKKFKDPDLLALLDNTIDSAPGIPIGNYLSQYFANFYLTYFDHWLREKEGVKYCFRYADDIVILSSNKPFLHQLLHKIKCYLWDNLKLEVKHTYQVFPVEARGIDFLGYVFRHRYVKLRKSIKKNFARAVAKGRTRSIPSHYGWAVHCDSINLLNKLLKNDQVQRPEYQNRIETDGRAKGIHQYHFRKRNRSSPLPNHSIKVLGQRQWPMPVNADKLQRGKESGIYIFGGFTTNTGEDPGRFISN